MIVWNQWPRRSKPSLWSRTWKQFAQPVDSSSCGSHHGGAWERLIRIIKKTLYSVTKEQTMDDECLHTALCKVEAILNARPITSTSGDPKDPEPLTPNHLLLLKGKPILPPGLFNRQDCYSRRRWKQVQYLSDLFWKRWTRVSIALVQAGHDVRLSSVQYQ